MKNAFREILETLDVRRARDLWKRCFPHFYQPKDDDETLVMLHHARVQSDFMPNKAKAYSTAWLTERELQAVEPIIVSAVGISSTSSDPGLKVAIESAMSRVVEGALDGGMDLEKDAAEIRKAMLDARWKVKAGRISI